MYKSTLIKVSWILVGIIIILIGIIIYMIIAKPLC